MNANTARELEYAKDYALDSGKEFDDAEFLSKSDTAIKAFTSNNYSPPMMLHMVVAKLRRHREEMLERLRRYLEHKEMLERRPVPKKPIVVEVD